MSKFYRLLIIIFLFIFASVALMSSCNQDNEDEDDSDNDENDGDDDNDDDDDDLPEGTNPHDECRRLLGDDDDDDDDDDWWKADDPKDDDTSNDDVDDDDLNDDGDDDDVTPGENPRYDACYNCVLQCNLGLQSGHDFEDGPCLSNNIIEGWACDIVHRPRNSADGLAINQCPLYPQESEHKIDVSTTCDFVSAN